MARQITVGWEHEDESYRVTGNLTPGREATGPRYDSAGEPAEGPEFEVVSVREDRSGGALRPDLVSVAQADLGLVGEAEEAEREAAECAREDAAESRHEYRAERGW